MVSVVRMFSLSVFSMAIAFSHPVSAGTASADSSKGTVFSWDRTLMDGSRTGCKSPSADDVSRSVGSVRGRKFFAPSGRIFKGGTIARVASVVLEAQPAMAPVKKVIGYSPVAMVREYPECALSDLFIDRIMEATERLSGRKVDIGIANFGGIRVDMPEGDILEDDILSMFPFRNTIVHVSLKGRDVRAVLEQMAATQFQVIGGMKVVAENGRIVSVEIGGEPLDDEKVYGLATISFLLNGGDDLYLGKNALEIHNLENVDISDVMMEYVENETAAGRPVQYSTDGRVVIR